MGERRGNICFDVQQYSTVGDKKSNVHLISFAEEQKKTRLIIVLSSGRGLQGGSRMKFVFQALERAKKTVVYFSTSITPGGVVV